MDETVEKIKRTIAHLEEDRRQMQLTQEGYGFLTAFNLMLVMAEKIQELHDGKE